MSFEEAITLPQNFRHYKISYQDKEYNLKELCNEFNLKYDTVYKRIKKYGWSLEKATNLKHVIGNWRIVNERVFIRFIFYGRNSSFCWVSITFFCLFLNDRDIDFIL